MNRETGGAILAFAGFVFIVGAFKGTWRNTIDALLGKATTPGAKAATSSPSSPGLPGSTPKRTGTGVGTGSRPLGQ